MWSSFAALLVMLKAESSVEWELAAGEKLLVGAHYAALLIQGPLLSRYSQAFSESLFDLEIVQKCCDVWLCQ